MLCRCLVWLVIVELPQGSPPPILDFGGRPRLGRVATGRCSMVQGGRFQPVYGHFVLPASDVEEKVLGMPRNHRKKAVIRWLQWRLVCVTTNKNKTSLLEACWHVCAVFTMGRCGCRPKRVSNVADVRRYSCTVYIVIVVCNVSSLYKSQERRLSHCCSTTLQPATSCVKYIIIFGQIIYIFSRRGLGPTTFRADTELAQETGVWWIR